MHAAVIEYLRWQKFESLRQVPGSQFNLMAPGTLFPKGAPERPEPWDLYKKCSRWGLWWPGGVADQPHILMQEFETCQAAENYFAAVIGPEMERFAHASASRT